MLTPSSLSRLIRPSQAPPARHWIHEAPESLGQYHPNHCQGRHHDHWGETGVQTAGECTSMCRVSSLLWCTAATWRQTTSKSDRFASRSQSLSELWLLSFLSVSLWFVLQVRKELEMSGIEFYPQKEFDEDMEDKSDNDKIRVRGALICFCFCFFFTFGSFPPPFQPPAPERMSGHWGVFCYLFSPHKSCEAVFGTLNHVEMSPFNRRPCPLPWWAATKNIKSMENEFWGGRFRGESLKVVDVAFCLPTCSLPET